MRKLKCTVGALCVWLALLLPEGAQRGSLGLEAGIALTLALLALAVWLLWSAGVLPGSCGSFSNRNDMFRFEEEEPGKSTSIADFRRCEAFARATTKKDARACARGSDAAAADLASRKELK